MRYLRLVPVSFQMRYNGLGAAAWGAEGATASQGFRPGVLSSFLQEGASKVLAFGVQARSVGFYTQGH